MKMAKILLLSPSATICWLHRMVAGRGHVAEEKTDAAHQGHTHSGNRDRQYRVRHGSDPFKHDSYNAWEGVQGSLEGGVPR